MAKGMGAIYAAASQAVAEYGLGKYMAALCERAGVEGQVCPVTGDTWRNNGVVLVEDGQGAGKEAFDALRQAMRESGQTLIMAFYLGDPDRPDEWAFVRWRGDGGSAYRRIVLGTSVMHSFSDFDPADQQIALLPERLNVWVCPEFEGLDWSALAAARAARLAEMQAAEEAEQQARAEAAARERAEKAAALARRQAEYFAGNLFRGRLDGTTLPEDWTVAKSDSFGDRQNPIIVAFGPHITQADLEQIIGWLGGGEITPIGRGGVIIKAGSPGLVIGRGGSTVKSLSLALGKRIVVQ